MKNLLESSFVNWKESVTTHLEKITQKIKKLAPSAHQLEIDVHRTRKGLIQSRVAFKLENRTFTTKKEHYDFQKVQKMTINSIKNQLEKFRHQKNHFFYRSDQVLLS